MMCYGGRDLASSFRTVRKNTLQIAQEIPEDQYGFSAAPGVKTVGQILTHMALSYRFQFAIHAEQKVATLVGFDFPGLMGRISTEEQQVRTKADVIALLTRNGEQFATWADGLSDEFLCERVAMHPGQEPASKSRLEMIMGVKEHEMHHRGQLMLVERLLGMTPHLTRQMQERMAARP